jgi:hypothetical protein
MSREAECAVAHDRLSRIRSHLWRYSAALGLQRLAAPRGIGRGLNYTSLCALGSKCGSGNFLSMNVKAEQFWALTFVYYRRGRMRGRRVGLHAVHGLAPRRIGAKLHRGHPVESWG